MLFLQFQNVGEIPEFAKLAGISPDEMIARYNAAAEKDLICVFEFRDTETNRKRLSEWRNR